MTLLDGDNNNNGDLKLELESVFFLRREKDHPVFEDGLQVAYLRLDVKTVIDRMKKVLTAEERTGMTLVLLASGIKDLI